MLHLLNSSRGLSQEVGSCDAEALLQVVLFEKSWCAMMLERRFSSASDRPSELDARRSLGPEQRRSDLQQQSAELTLGTSQLDPPDYRGAAAALLHRFVSLGTAKVFPRQIFYPYGWWEQGRWSPHICCLKLRSSM